MAERFSLPFIREVTYAIHKCGASPVLHICGDTTHLITGMPRSGAEGLSLDSPVDLPFVADSVPTDLVLMGNIAPVKVMLEKGPEAVKAETFRLSRAMRSRKNFILDTGCDLSLDTPHENIDALIEMASGHGVQPPSSLKGEER